MCVRNRGEGAGPPRGTSPTPGFVPWGVWGTDFGGYFGTAECFPVARTALGPGRAQVSRPSAAEGCAGQSGPGRRCTPGDPV